MRTTLTGIIDLLIAQAETGSLTLKNVLIVLGSRGHAAFIILFCILLLIPFGFFPGSATLLGVGIMIVSVQLVLGSNKLWLPNRLLMKSLPARTMLPWLKKFRNTSQNIDYYTGRRLTWLVTHDMSARLAGVVISMQAIIIIIFGFIPGASFIALPILCIATGLLVQDGVVFLVSYFLSLIGFLSAIFFILTAVSYFNS